MPQLLHKRSFEIKKYCKSFYLLGGWDNGLTLKKSKAQGPEKYSHQTSGRERNRKENCPVIVWTKCPCDGHKMYHKHLTLLLRKYISRLAFSHTHISALSCLSVTRLKGLTVRQRPGIHDLLTFAVVLVFGGEQLTGRRQQIVSDCIN